MKVSRPATKQPLFEAARLSGAFVLDEGVIASIERAFFAICGQPSSIRYRIVAQDGTRYEVESAAEIGHLPIDDVRGRKSFEIELQAGEVLDLERAHIVFGFSTPSAVAITAYSASNAAFILRQMRARVDASRAWYSWVHSTWFVWLLSPVIYLMGFAFPLGVTGWSPAREKYALFAVLMSILFLIWIGRSKLFDPLVLEWGAGKKRNERLVGARRVVFGVLALGLCSILLNALATRWLT
ncbi:hypothetical protein [uncultured Brevundimonas sp.]|uniref:hypothetical protein n=1 Tax=uncultured Brevundimonas sp. TaxID=213418 RepID=UPI002591C3F3|nr:hypothetical protein [uncultured Brevundimonas sp.]